MTLEKHNKFNLAENQLEAAIGLFVSGGDKFSVVTLAGAADVILCQLVLNRGEENFTQISLKNEMERCDTTGTIKSHGKEINDLFFINHLKHMDKGEDGYIELDPDECAVGAILKALANYVIIGSREKDFVQAFMAWVQINLDPKKYNIYGDPEWKPTT
ncbi:hypothetical protein [Candidatus Thiodiazotropha sp. CDECU1]|uniref:hypothetical protein n=1 Tax=Candidatus Thiodiazotropha sp. CDECU1 TaxID=3065865 RepID=UPI0029316C5D|nr:hypothetical protein [Candidatus Thiodiazotropha sp. CDECU1]